MKRNNLHFFKLGDAYFESWKISGVFYLVKQELWRVNATFLSLLLLIKAVFVRVLPLRSLSLNWVIGNIIASASWVERTAWQELSCERRKRRTSKETSAETKSNQDRLASISLKDEMYNSKVILYTFIFLPLLFSRLLISSLAFYRSLEFSFCPYKWPHVLVSLFLPFPSSDITARLPQFQRQNKPVLPPKCCLSNVQSEGGVPEKIPIWILRVLSCLSKGSVSVSGTASKRFLSQSRI